MFTYPRLFRYSVHYSENGEKENSIMCHKCTGVVVGSSFEDAFAKVYKEYSPEIMPSGIGYELESISVEEQDEMFHFIEELTDNAEEW